MQVSAAFLDPTAAMLDRLLQRSVVLNLYGDSYRLRDHNARAEEPHNNHRNPTTTTVNTPPGALAWVWESSAYGPPRTWVPDLRP